MANEKPDAIPTTADERRLDLLRRIAGAGGRIAPTADPLAEFGYRYVGHGDGDEKNLNDLARRGYLDERFFERVSLCPRCNSHHLNVREICPSCQRARLAGEVLLHHFRCGYVGVAAEFAAGMGGSRICPKCNGGLRHLGTEYDRLGKTFVCRECGTMSEDPPVEAACLTCGTRTPAEDLVAADVFSYVLTSLGSAAIRRGSLADSDERFFIDDAPVYRPGVICEFLDYEAKRLRRLGGGFSLLLAEYSRELADGKQDGLTGWLTRLRRCVREIDLLGQLAEAVFVVILSQTDKGGAETVRQRVSAELGPQMPFVLSTIAIAEPADLASVLAYRGAVREAA
jgi:hypothetical protein